MQCRCAVGTAVVLSCDSHVDRTDDCDQTQTHCGLRGPVVRWCWCVVVSRQIMNHNGNYRIHLDTDGTLRYTAFPGFVNAHAWIWTWEWTWITRARARACAPTPVHDLQNLLELRGLRLGDKLLPAGKDLDRNLNGVVVGAHREPQIARHAHRPKVRVRRVPCVPHNIHNIKPLHNLDVGQGVDAHAPRGSHRLLGRRSTAGAQAAGDRPAHHAAG